MKWVLCCTKDNNVRVVGDEHEYAVFGDSPMGKAMMTAAREPAMGQRRYVLVSDMPGPAAGEGHAFEDLGNRGVHYPQNLGKEWVMRELVSTGREMVGRNTVTTMQSFHTWLCNGDPHLKIMGPSSMVFQVVTHVRACKNGRCYTFDVHNHFHFVPSDFLSGDEARMTMADASADFRDDLGAILQNIDNPRMGIEPTTTIHAERGYEVRGMPHVLGGSTEGAVARGGSICSKMMSK